MCNQFQTMKKQLTNLLLILIVLIPMSILSQHDGNQQELFTATQFQDPRLESYINGSGYENISQFYNPGNLFIQGDRTIYNLSDRYAQFVIATKPQLEIQGHNYFPTADITDKIFIVLYEILESGQRRSLFTKEYEQNRNVDLELILDLKNMNLLNTTSNKYVIQAFLNCPDINSVNCYPDEFSLQLFKIQRNKIILTSTCQNIEE